tara:strand:- start:2269 stop:2523 length:255 start_codon:yes stop_codon:yes gene_type:complete
MLFDDKIAQAHLTAELIDEYGSLIEFQDIANFFGWSARIGKERIEQVRVQGLVVFKMFNSNKAPSYVCAKDFAKFIMKQRDKAA